MTKPVPRRPWERWPLEKDPSNDMLIGPDGCNYDTEHEVYHFGVLGMCGCGQPEEVYNFLLECMRAFDRRANREGKGPWINAEDRVKDLILANPDMAAHAISHFLDHTHVLEHGGSVGGSWLSQLGEQVVDAGPRPEPTDD